MNTHENNLNAIPPEKKELKQVNAQLEQLMDLSNQVDPEEFERMMAESRLDEISQ